MKTFFSEIAWIWTEKPIEFSGKSLVLPKSFWAPSPMCERHCPLLGKMLLCIKQKDVRYYGLLTRYPGIYFKRFDDGIGVQCTLLDMSLPKIEVTVTPKTATFTTTSIAPLRKIWIEVICMFLETPFASGSFTLCFTSWPIIAAESHYVKCCKYQKHLQTALCRPTFRPTA